MVDDSRRLIERLFETENLNPILKASYEEELNRTLEPKLTPRTALPGVVLLVILVACIAGIVRNLFLYEASALVVLSWIVMGGTFAWVANLIIRDLLRQRHTRGAELSISQALYFAGGAITVASLLSGLSEPENVASTFNVLFVFVFYFTCATWSLMNRISTAELAAREQMLRIEYRLADLSERLGK